MTKSIPLSKGLVAIVDDEDYDELSLVKWHADNRGYAVRCVRFPIGPRKILMHRHIMQTGRGIEVDHIDGNRLNNQRSNLRTATSAENKRNQRPTRGGSSKYKGVTWNTRLQRWVAQIGVNRKSIYIGSFKDETEAAKAYDKAARQHFGEFACTNFGA